MIQSIVASLAVYRLSKLITSEEFFGGWMAKIRKKMGVKGQVYLDIETGLNHFEEYPSHLQESVLSRGITCLWCVSFWVGLVVSFIVFDGFVNAVLHGLAMSTVSILIDKVVVNG